MDILEKLNYLNETKELIKNKIKDLGGEVTGETTFRNYATILDEVYEDSPKVTGEGTSITLNNTKQGKLELELKGNLEVKSGGVTSIPTDNPFTFLSLAQPTREMTVPQITTTQITDDFESTDMSKFNSFILVAPAGSKDSLCDIRIICFNKNKVKFYLDSSTHTLKHNANDVSPYVFPKMYKWRAGRIFSETNYSYNDASQGSWTYEDMFNPNNFKWDFSNPYNQIIFTNTNIYTDNTYTDIYIAEPTPLIKTVTGSQTITIDENTFPLSLGTIEMAKVSSHTDKFEKSNGNWVVANKVQKIASYNGETITTDYVSSTGGLDTGAIVYYNSNETLTITDNTLIGQLDNLNNVYSSNNSTTISSSGDLPIIIKATALKGGN